MGAKRHPDPPPALRERAFRLYMETDITLRDIARLLGLSYKVMRDRRRNWGWPDRTFVLRTGRRPLNPELWPEAAPKALPDLPALPDLAASSNIPGPAAPLPAAQRSGQESGQDPRRQDPAAAALRLERLVAARIDALAAEAALGRERDPERTDRRLVQLERLLAQLHRRRGYDGGPDDTPPARSVAALRDDLLRHLQRLRTQTRSRQLARDADGA